MTSVLVVWEDQYHGKLDLCLKRALRHLALSSPELHCVNCRGNGGFAPFVERAWPAAAQHGLPRSRGPIDHLVCVADADRAHECCTVDKPTGFVGTTAEWVERANRSWIEKLRRVATIAPERIHGRFLRWNQESLLIAAHDLEPVLAALGCQHQSRVVKHLQACNPSPMRVPDAEFIDHFRKPERCLEDMLKAAGAGVPRKGTPPRADALEIASVRAIERLCARVPDLAGLARFVSGLATEPSPSSPV